jgi:superfamily II DNA/RNA helicase
MTFIDFNLSVETLKGIEELSYTHPTEIQQQVIPQVLLKRDLCGVAQTGSGKTGSFVIPILELLKTSRQRARMPRCLVLVPTRELAHQVEKAFSQLGKYHKIRQAVVIGGESPILQERQFRAGIDVVIATPGRLLDHYERGNIILHAAEIIVIDEADRMLDMGFIPDIERLMVALSHQTRQTLCFSATMPGPIKKLVSEFLTDPTYISIDTKTQTAETVDQYFIRTPKDGKAKRDILRTLLEKEQIKSAIIFCNRKVDVSTVTRSLTHYKLNAAALHGDLKQSLRTKTLEAFKNGEIDYLVASDVAARGLDIEELPYVINFDLPNNPEEYVHRVGRTGRAGRSGKAYSFVGTTDEADLAKFKKFIHQDMVFIDIEGKPSKGKQSKVKQSEGNHKDSHKKSAEKQDAFSAIGFRSPNPDVRFSYPGNPVKGFGKFTPRFFEVDYKIPK